jgi:aspartyl protease family protein
MRTFAVVSAVLLTLVASAALVSWVFGWEMSADYVDERAASVVWLATIGALLASGIVVGLRQNFSQTLVGILAWVGIFLLVLVAYSFRDEARSLWSRVRAEIFAGEAITTAPGEIEVRRAGDGHFYLETLVNGATVPFMVDTGASMIALSWDDARRAGFEPTRLSFTNRVMTASGPAMAASVYLGLITAGPIRREGVRASVLPEGVEGSLLGLTFLDTLSSYEIRGDRLILRD